MNVSYALPGWKEEKHVQVQAVNSLPQSEAKKAYIPKNAFTYTPAAEQSQNYTTTETVRSSHTHTLPYRTDYENRYNEGYSYHTLDGPKMSTSKSDSDMPYSWLQQQQLKLRAMKDGHDKKRTQQEMMLVQELKSAQTKYITKRAESDTDERATQEIFNASSPPLLMNGPVSPPRSQGVTSQTYHVYKTERSQSQPTKLQPLPDDSVFDSYFETHNTQNRENNIVFGASKPLSNKPPPSPTTVRAITPTLPIIPPVRSSSSKDAVHRTRTTTTNTSREWQASERPLQRQNSDTSFDRSRKNVIHARSHTPPGSPRSLSPTGQSYQTTTYRTYRTMGDNNYGFDTVPAQRTRHESLETQPRMHYVTEVFIHRTGGEGKVYNMEFSIYSYYLAMDNLIRIGLSMIIF